MVDDTHCFGRSRPLFGLYQKLFTASVRSFYSIFWLPHLCEEAFSQIKIIKSRYQSRLTDEYWNYCLHLWLSNYEISFSDLISLRVSLFITFISDGFASSVSNLDLSFLIFCLAYLPRLLRLLIAWFHNTVISWCFRTALSMCWVKATPLQAWTGPEVSRRLRGS
jgi:hypothetical protein